ncbi:MULTISPECIES: S9 family peptidase [unclassified Janthinobacterium]|uniref:S9 family peptidase n=1 Tax=unclassified Janthinobacterium TaxID=2610881 RepID=UPI0004776CFD|nr:MULTISPECIES: S9 family peptidase [unclassified Janthinobacterium]MEC5162833.1 dipeptidyl aminopeptidase/acylaminoacyl peptidase [Janthinobacterium sp. CG_S6]
MTSASSSITAPFGVWPSPISAALVAAGAAPLSQLALGGADGGDIFWLAGRATEAGRNTLLRQRCASVDELTPAPWNVRSRVHEYGGGAYAVDGATVYFSHFADNRVYVQRDGADPLALTRAGTQRHADFVVDRQRQRLIGVRELHPAEGHAHPVNSICAIAADGAETVLAQGHDFFAAPRLSPDGGFLAWLSWDHPRMPWQGTELWLAEVGADGALSTPRLIAGGARESVCQPEWSPDGLLHFVSDSSGWWNLYRLRGADVEALCPMQAEFACPHWTFGVAMYGFRSAGEIVCTYIENGVSRLGRLRAGGAKLETIANPYQEIRELRVGPGFVALLGGGPTIPLELARIDFANGELEVLARSIAEPPAGAYLSVPESVVYPSSGGRQAHAFFYPPRNDDYAGGPGTKPPLIVIIHGGPTSMASNTLKLATQFWTSRGFGVLDVNYGGSSGFGRAYRDALQGEWGVVDVDDCVAGARYLVERGLVDPERLIIRGGSAGGYTTLCALTFHDVFKAGASYYGVSDLKGLDQDSHKFESHYNEYLIAPAPRAEALYLERSPIHHTDRLKRPMIFFQGLDDKVVPPQQSVLMVEALKARGVPVAYVEIEGEGHGFRKAENIVRTLEAELYFYLRVFGLDAPGAAAAVRIHNLP